MCLRENGGVHCRLIGGGTDEKVAGGIAGCESPVVPDYLPCVREELEQFGCLGANHRDIAAAEEQRNHFALGDSAAANNEAFSVLKVEERGIEHRLAVTPFAKEGSLHIA